MKHSTTIKIDGSKFRALIEEKTGKTIYQVSKESGYSENVLSNAIRTGYASSAVQNIARLYGILPEAYTLKEEEIKPAGEPKQITFEDLTSETIKRLVKEAIIELMPEITKIRQDIIKEAYNRGVSAGIKAAREFTKSAEIIKAGSIPENDKPIKEVKNG